MIDDRLGRLPSVTKLNKDVPPSISAIVNKCLQGEPNQRYDNFDQVVIDLERHQNHLPLKHTSNPSFGERIKKWCKRHPKLLSNFSLATVSMILITSLVFGIVVRNFRMRQLKAVDVILRTERILPELSASISSPILDPFAARQIRNDLDDLSKQFGFGESDQGSQLSVPPSERNRYNDVAKKILFLSAEVECQDPVDVDDDGHLNITDVVYLTKYLFAGGDPPPFPFPNPGTDRSPDSLGDCR